MDWYLGRKPNLKHDVGDWPQYVKNGTVNQSEMDDFCTARQALSFGKIWVSHEHSTSTWRCLECGPCRNGSRAALRLLLGDVHLDPPGRRPDAHAVDHHKVEDTPPQQEVFLNTNNKTSSDRTLREGNRDPRSRFCV